MENFWDFLKRFFAFLAGPVVGSGISFLIVPLTTWLVSPSEFGKASIYSFAISLFSLVVFLGLDQAYVREYHETKDRSSLFMNSLFFPLIFSFITSLIVFFLWRSFSLALFGEEDFLSAIIFVFAFPFTVLERFNILSIRMQERAGLYSVLIILRQLIRAPMILLFLFFVRDFHGIILAEATTQVLVPLLSGYASRKNWSFPFPFDKRLIKSLLRFGLPLLPATILMWIFNAMATISLRYWGTFEEVGIYSSAFKIISVLNIFNSAFSTFWVPTAYRWRREGVDFQKFECVGNILCIFMTFLGFAVIAGRHIIVLMLSPAYKTASALLPFLVFIPVMYSISEVTVVGINFSKRTEFHLLISILSVIVNIFCNLLFVPKLGAQGAAIAMGVSYICFFGFRTVISCKLWNRIRYSIYSINVFLLIVFAVLAQVNFYPLFWQLSIFLIWVAKNRKYIARIMAFEPKFRQH